MVFICHTSIKVISHHEAYIPHWQPSTLCLAHYPYTPINISTKAIIKVIWCLFCQVGTGIESLMTHQHTIHKRAPCKLLRCRKSTMADKVALSIHYISIAI